MSRVLANGLRDLGSIESHQRLKKIELDAALLNIQHYVRIKGKAEQSGEWSSAFLHTSA